MMDLCERSRRHRSRVEASEARQRIRPEGLFLYRFTERNMFVVERAK